MGDSISYYESEILVILKCGYIYIFSNTSSSYFTNFNKRIKIIYYKKYIIFYDFKGTKYVFLMLIFIDTFKNIIQ